MPDTADPIGWAAGRLSECGVESPRLEAQLLLALALGITRTAVSAGLFGSLDSAQRGRFHDLVESRCGRTPLAYLRGTQEFYALDFEVGPAVLIPRPETEMLVEFALEKMASAASSSSAVAESFSSRCAWAGNARDARTGFAHPHAGTRPAACDGAVDGMNCWREKGLGCPPALPIASAQDSLSPRSKSGCSWQANDRVTHGFFAPTMNSFAVWPSAACPSVTNRDCLSGGNY